MAVDPFKENPMWRLFEYACNKLYYVEYGEIPKRLFGILVNCGGTLYAFLGEKGLYMIKVNDIKSLEPASMPKTISDEFRKVIEDYLQVSATQKT